VIAHSDEIDQLFAAVSEAQGKIANAAKDAKNPHFRSTYADLASVRDAIREPLAAAGLAVMQFPSTEIRELANGGLWMAVRIVTRMCHSSGQWIEDELLVPVSRQDAQSIGSAITYGRRYSLMAITGVAPDDDDDGNAAADVAPSQQQHAQPAQRGPSRASRPPAQHAGQRPPAPAAAAPAPAPAPAQPVNGDDIASCLAYHESRMDQAETLAALRAVFSSAQRDLRARGADPDTLGALEAAKDARKIRLEQQVAEAGPESQPADAGAQSTAAPAAH